MNLIISFHNCNPKALHENPPCSSSIWSLSPQSHVWALLRSFSGVTKSVCSLRRNYCRRNQGCLPSFNFTTNSQPGQNPAKGKLPSIPQRRSLQAHKSLFQHSQMVILCEQLSVPSSPGKLLDIITLLWLTKCACGFSRRRFVQQSCGKPTCARSIHVYPVRACAKGLSNRFCSSVSQSVSQSVSPMKNF